jgi:hypothetical protein
MNVNPGFVSSTNMHLAESSPCIGKGTNLSSYFTMDCEGKARSGTGAFSLGAYEAGATPPTPPAPAEGPVLSWPADGVADVPLAPSLTWNSVSGASSYTLQVATDAAFATLKVNQTGITANSFDAPGLANGTKYYWRVNYSGSAGTSAWSAAKTFTTVAAPTPPPAAAGPVLWWPADGAMDVPLAPSLTWSTVSGASSYTLQVATDAAFAALKVNQTGITANSFDAPGLTNGTRYYWRVNYSGPTGTTSAWSPARSFTTIAGPSPTLNLWWPKNGATGVVINPSLTWSPDSGALSYSLQVATDSGFSKLTAEKTGIAANSFEVTGLAGNTVYFWRVRVTNTIGSSGWTTAWKFTVSNNGTVGSTTPIFGTPHPSHPRVLDLSPCSNGAVRIGLPQSGSFELSFYSLDGRKSCESLVKTGIAGYTTMTLTNLGLSNGYYVVRLSMRGISVSRKVFMVN